MNLYTRRGAGRG